ncbi:MAG: hypothetical protein JXR73_01630 [Candidatus Omnitrophica bacterium]|nr:hypothetical protein [Candidatus Omnitrophota bacterium]
MKKSPINKKAPGNPDASQSVFSWILLYGGGMYVVFLLASTLVAAISLPGKDVLYYFRIMNFFQWAGSLAAAVVLGAVFYAIYNSNE